LPTCARRVVLSTRAAKRRLSSTSCAPLLVLLLT